MQHQSNINDPVPAVTDGAALYGVKVLDLSRFIAGPLCAQILADLGANVIKVERRGGEDSRFIEPTFNGKSLYVAQYSRNKRAITLDTRTTKGRNLLRELAQWADVLVENYRPGTLAKMGLSHDELLRLNPRLVITAISGFGQDGPYAHRPLFDPIAQAMSGLMFRNGTTDTGPLLTPMFPADTLAALYGAIGTLAALRHRDSTGSGQVVDLAVFDSLVTSLGTPLPARALLGLEEQRLGNRDAYNAPANVFVTLDGHVYLHAGTQAFWQRMCTEVLERPELATEPPLNTVAGRMANTERVEALVGEWTAARTSEEVVNALAKVGIPCGQVATTADLVSDPLVEARGLLVRGRDVDGDEYVALANPLHMSATPPRYSAPPPVVGQHTRAILGEVLGRSEEEIDGLIAEEVL